MEILIFYENWVTKTVKNDRKEQKWGLLSMLLGTLGAGLLGNLLTGKGIVRAGTGKEWVWNTTSSFNKFWNTEIL